MIRRDWFAEVGRGVKVGGSVEVRRMTWKGL
jgi:hypothetical protein